MRDTRTECGDMPGVASPRCCLHRMPPVGGASRNALGQGAILTRRMYRRQLSVWQDGSFFQFQVDTDTATLRMGRRGTVKPDGCR